MYELRKLDPAEQGLAKLDVQSAKRIIKRIRWLAENFDSIKPEALHGELAGLFKLRVGDYRVVYQVLRDERQMVIHDVGHPREIYKTK